MLSKEHKERLVNRVQGCRERIARAKKDLRFWNIALTQAVEELAQDKQFNFDEIFKKEI